MQTSHTYSEFQCIALSKVAEHLIFFRDACEKKLYSIRQIQEFLDGFSIDEIAREIEEFYEIGDFSTSITELVYYMIEDLSDIPGVEPIGANFEDLKKELQSKKWYVNVF